MDILVHIVEEEVLKLLPAVVLHRRIRVVCRRWRDLVDSPRFGKSHSAHHSRNKQIYPPPHVLGVTSFGKGVYRCNPFVAGSQTQKGWVRQDVYNHIRVFKACGGLLFGQMGNDYVVLNPLTTALKVLPPPPLKVVIVWRSALVLEPCMQGYWICVADNKKKQLLVYSSRSGVWDKVDYLPGWNRLENGVGMANSNAYFPCEHECMWGALSFNMEEMRWTVEWSSFMGHSPVEACWNVYNWVVTPATQFFKVAVVNDFGVRKMMLVRLDCASKRFVEETSFPYNAGHIALLPICFYEGTLMIPDKYKLFFLDCESMAWSSIPLQNPLLLRSVCL
ncbi:uncharacterized protein LOC9647508 [Selaginella moellendorffii]|uniref:uncharacterized protein LOC9647508 n=1 Tax=Selaginella moellendorffii TaxID=88036 RepID=UPI000D1CA4AB|nr:uncharacterized protein LOC9647508 [Selaginella moellendorffii]|eukprot:XP_024541008.1 uncharacterized protein LOC9647508 [Selaginella moellendorffii]